MQNRKSELLMPAGSLDKLKMAVLYGADAIYMGTPDMSMRAKSAFTLEEVIEGIDYAHQHGKRVYLTLNMFAHNKDIPKLPEYLDTVRKVKPDGLIVADPGVFNFVKEYAPELELHVSTQANICSSLTVDFWKGQGAELCVLAREVTFPELKEIREKCQDIKLEVFVHGAMCMTYSGRCLLSNFMTERGANQGNCANSCRWHYKLNIRLKDGTTSELNITEENKELFEFLLEESCRPGEFMPFEEDERGAYIMNSKDLCLMPKLDEYLELGIDSLKVEGRNKSLYYVAVVARAYRMAIDAWRKDPENWNPKPYIEELETVHNRGYTMAFHEGRLTHHAHNYVDTRSLSEYEFAGMITEIRDDAFIVQVKNKLEEGDVLEFLPPHSPDLVLLRIYEFENAETGEITKDAVSGKQPFIRIPFSLFEHEDIDEMKQNFPAMSVVRKERSLTKEEWNRLRMDSAGQKLELGEAPEARYDARKKDLQDAITEGQTDRRQKTPRFGIEGCCGKGCNGCQIFWYDPSYKKARELLAKKKQGEMFDKDMIEKDIAENTASTA